MSHHPQRGILAQYIRPRKKSLWPLYVAEEPLNFSPRTPKNRTNGTDTSLTVISSISRKSAIRNYSDTRAEKRNWFLLEAIDPSHVRPQLRVRPSVRGFAS